MMQLHSIKTLYSLALAEGEGVGTAYEYFAKRLVLRPWLQTLPPIRRMLIAGLPEKYGASLDYILLAEELGATAVVADDRPESLEKFNASLVKARQMGWFTAGHIETVLVPTMASLAEVDGGVDLAIANEVIQRLPPADRLAYGQRQCELAAAVALFCPNAANPDHAAHSGLATLPLSDLPRLLPPSARIASSGYIDMPPFPTGVTRSEAQRAQAESGRFEAYIMWGLGYFARMEHWLPTAVRRQKSHIIYALLTS